MDICMNVIHEGKIGDKTMVLTINDENVNNNIFNMYLNNEHYRINLNELEQLISVLKMNKFSFNK